MRHRRHASPPPCVAAAARRRPRRRRDVPAGGAATQKRRAAPPTAALPTQHPAGAQVLQGLAPRPPGQAREPGRREALHRQARLRRALAGVRRVRERGAHVSVSSSSWCACSRPSLHRGDESRRRRCGCDLEIPWRRVAAATLRLRQSFNSVETSRGGAAAATWKFRGDESRRRRSCDLEIPRRRVAPTPPATRALAGAP